MIRPEPARVVHHANLDCAAGRHAWCSLEEVPAAGHLGVIEEACMGPVHAGTHDPIRHIRTPDMPCNVCGAVV